MQLSGRESPSCEYRRHRHLHHKALDCRHFQTDFCTMPQLSQKHWKSLSGPKLLKLIIAVSALAISYEGMSQGVMGAVNVAPEYGVSVLRPLTPLGAHLVGPRRLTHGIISDAWALPTRMARSSSPHCRAALSPHTTRAHSSGPSGLASSRTSTDVCLCLPARTAIGTEHR